VAFLVNQTIMTDKISVIIVDDFELSRVGLRYMLGNAPMVDTVREVSNSKDFFRLVKEDEPDLVLMDVQLDFESGIDVTQQLLKQHPDTFVIAITASKDIQHFTEMIEAGASGFLLKNVTHEELELAIKEVLAGNMYFSKEFLSAARKLIPNAGKKKKVNLSQREKEVLKLICLGNSNSEIAEALNLSTHTIDGYRKQLLSKIGAKNTASMIMISIKENLVDV
jgi:DNA-binding NarL/FixJ family response regulator